MKNTLAQCVFEGYEVLMEELMTLTHIVDSVGQ